MQVTSVRRQLQPTFFNRRCLYIHSLKRHYNINVISQIKCSVFSISIIKTKSWKKKVMGKSLLAQISPLRATIIDAFQEIQRVQTSVRDSYSLIRKRTPPSPDPYRAASTAVSQETRQTGVSEKSCATHQ